MKEKYFTPMEATQTIPVLEHAFFRIHQLKLLAQGAFSRLEARGFAPKNEHFDIHPAGESFDVVEDLASLKILMLELRAQIDMLMNKGFIIKNIAIGLVDFPSQKKGKDIFLCWKLGEKEVRYWHAVGAGFQDRQPLVN